MTVRRICSHSLACSMCSTSPFLSRAACAVSFGDTRPAQVAGCAALSRAPSSSCLSSTGAFGMSAKMSVSPALRILFGVLWWRTNNHSHLRQARTKCATTSPGSLGSFSVTGSTLLTVSEQYCLSDGSLESTLLSSPPTTSTSASVVLVSRHLSTLGTNIVSLGHVFRAAFNNFVYAALASPSSWQATTSSPVAIFHSVRCHGREYSAA